MTSIVFLDDDVARHLRFAEVYAGARQVTTPFAAIQEIKHGDGVHELWLDHDLGFVAVGDFGALSGDNYRAITAMPVVDYIVEHRPKIDFIRVHSWNPPAARTMAQRLRDAGYDVHQEPFCFQGDRL